MKNFSQEAFGKWVDLPACRQGKRAAAHQSGAMAPRKREFSRGGSIEAARAQQALLTGIGNDRH